MQIPDSHLRQDWARHPVTLYILDLIMKDKKLHQEMFSDGGMLADTEFETVKGCLLAIGRMQGLDYIYSEIKSITSEEEEDD